MSNDHRREWHGATYSISPSDHDRHGGDPLAQVVRNEPPGYTNRQAIERWCRAWSDEHPQRLGRDVLDPGGPRILPVSQAVPNGPERSREEEFEQALREDAGALHTFHSLNVFNDRRVEGRRHRPTDFVEDLLGSAQVPYDNRGFQRDIPLDRYYTM
jgi:hypothetical protein